MWLSRYLIAAEVVGGLVKHRVVRVGDRAHDELPEHESSALASRPAGRVPLNDAERCDGPLVPPSRANAHMRAHAHAHQTPHRQAIRQEGEPFFLDLRHRMRASSCIAAHSHAREEAGPCARGGEQGAGNLDGVHGTFQDS